MADFFSDQDIATFTALTESAMPDTCEIQARTVVQDGRGKTVTYPVRNGPGGEAQTAVPCRVTTEAASPDGTVTPAGDPVPDPTFQVVVPLGTAVEEGDRVKVTVSQTGEEHLLEVAVKAQPHTYSVDIRLNCTRWSE